MPSPGSSSTRCRRGPMWTALPPSWGGCSSCRLLEPQVARTPAVTALVFGDTALSFAELNAAANRLAHHLIDRGAGPERIVALALPRSAEMVVALLAVAKAGGVYLPVDPELPAERIAFLLGDAQPVLVVTTTDARAVHAALSEDTPRLLVDHPDTHAP